MGNTPDRSPSCVGLSLLIHAGLVAAIFFASSLGLLPEGTQPVANAIEMATVEVSQGQQVVTPEPVPEVPEQAASAQPAPQPKKVAGKSKPKKSVATQLPEKVNVSEPQPEVADSQTEAVAVLPVVEESPEIADVEDLETSNEELATTAQQTEPEQVEEEVTPIVAPNPTSTTDTKSQSNEEINSALDAKKELAETTTQPEAAGSPSDMAFGVSSGTRSYLDLKQRPGNVPPQYPTTARRNGWQGNVILNYYVNADGTVRDVKIAQSSGVEMLDQEAVQAVSKYRYVPGQEGTVEHPVIFSLKGPAKPMPTRLRTKNG